MENDKKQAIHAENWAKLNQINEGIDEKVDKLLAYSNDDDPLVRDFALESLSRFYNNQTASRMLEALKDESELVRSTAAEILGTWKHRPAVDMLVKLLDDDSKMVRSWAAVGLGDIKDAQIIPVLLSRLEVCDDDEKHVFLYALCQHKPKEYILSFLNCIFHESSDVRDWIANLSVDILAEHYDCINVDFIRNLLTIVMNDEKSTLDRSIFEEALTRINEMEL